MAFNLIKTTPNKDGFQDRIDILAISENKNLLEEYAKKEFDTEIVPLEFFTMDPYFSIEKCDTIILS